MTISARVGYIRVSSESQNLDRQVTRLSSLNLDKIFTDTTSGKNVDRIGFQQMLEYLREGDELFVCSMDRLARNLNDLLTVTDTLQKRGVSIHFLKENLVLSPKGETSAISKLLLSMMGAVAEFERALIRERQQEGIVLAKARGVYKGRKPIDAAVIEKAKELIELGIPISRVAKDLKICRGTIYQYLKKAKEPQNS